MFSYMSHSNQEHIHTLDTRVHTKDKKRRKDSEYMYMIVKEIYVGRKGLQLV